MDFFKRSISWWMEGHASLALGNLAMIIYKLGCVAFEQGSLSEAAKYFRQSLEISRLYPALPMEQARTCFMLSEALQKGAEPAEPEEASKTDQDVTSLTEAFFKSSRKSEGKPPFLRGSDFNIYITAKYQ
ncbi:uncharacterized protein DNG_04652 [Cephalotrichum gorgonifer]|uniref:Uncharacterized protein n=1 Tax=Cephalotrichum gorgonifer TaxID=2041049 RepID=A0AAE8SV42_9PEZI|nr:uncharacterized protein DNG_04652 [Cephalotrichum gorgonifer]